MIKEVESELLYLSGLRIQNQSEDSPWNEPYLR